MKLQFEQKKALFMDEVASGWTKASMWTGKSHNSGRKKKQFEQKLPQFRQLKKLQFGQKSSQVGEKKPLVLQKILQHGQMKKPQFEQKKPLCRQQNL